MTKIICYVVLLALVACQPCPVVTDSPALKPWTADEQREILAEEKRLGPDSILIPALEDYHRMRAALR